MANIFQNLFKKVGKFSGYTDAVIKKTEQYVRSHHLVEFQNLLANFDTHIPMHVVQINNGDNVSFVVEPIPGIFAERVNGMPDPGEIETSALFFILNNGSTDRHAKMPSGYARESFPNSLHTGHRDNDREAILVSKKYHYTIEPRNWLDLVEQKYRDGLDKSHSLTAKEFFKQLIKR